MAHSEPAAALAARLRQLRLELGITQAQLAGALRVTGPLISSWESKTKPVPPPLERVGELATIFAGQRPADGTRWRPPPADRLTAAQLGRRQTIDAELTGLRTAAAGEAPATSANRLGPGGPWRFPEEQDVTIVCAELPKDLRNRYAEPSDPDYVEMYRYADLDSLMELHGHVRASNPNSLVTFKPAVRTPELAHDDFTTHLALLGGVDWNMTTRAAMERLRLPVRQVSKGEDDRETGEAAFEVTRPDGVDRYAASVETTEEGKRLAYDVAHFVRGPNPYNRQRTLTICNGMYGQGTYGAVRALTDARFRDRNAAYVRKHFPEGSAYSLLFRVDIVGGRAVTPDWTADGTVLHEWSEATG